jgi:hypothetical protein
VPWGFFMVSKLKKSLVLFITISTFPTFANGPVHQGKGKSGEPKAPSVDSIQPIRVESENNACREIPLSTRQLFYNHFQWHLSGVSAEKRKILAHRFAKLIAKAEKESSGNPASVTDMGLRGSATSVRAFYNDPHNQRRGSSGFLRISLATREKLLNNPNVKITHQTNYGLLQQSADRLTRRALNRDIYDFYKKLGISDKRQAYQYCGTEFLYAGRQAELMSAIKEAASCKEGVKSREEIKCFGELVTICPALNIDLALIQPAAYFQTRNAAPRCLSVFYELAGLNSNGN